MDPRDPLSVLEQECDTDEYASEDSEYEPELPPLVDEPDRDQYEPDDENTLDAVILGNLEYLLNDG
uniref:Uncharacterized protein n=1 Tax=Romanomermis culicivorax TaxID=13658 RepID=A0A915HUR7_ROMCU